MLAGTIAVFVVLTLVQLYSFEVGRSKSLTDELVAGRVKLTNTEKELATAKADLASTREKLESAQSQLASTATTLLSTQQTLSGVEGRLSTAQQELKSTARQLRIEKHVLEGIRELGIKQARRAAYVLEALKTTALQRRRWIRIGDQLAHEVTELKGKAATTEAVLVLLERVFRP